MQIVRNEVDRREGAVRLQEEAEDEASPRTHCVD